MNQSDAATRGGRKAGPYLAITIWLIAIGAVVFGARTWLPPLASEHGAGIDTMINFTMGTTGIMILLGHAVLGAFLWRFGGRDKVSFRMANYSMEKRWSLGVSLVMLVVAEGGVLALGLPVWGKVFDTAPPANSIVVEVTTEQFAWNVRYAGPDGVFGKAAPKLINLDNPIGVDKDDPAGKDDIIDLNTLRAVVNRPLHVRLRSKDVLHSFFLPNLRVKQDSVPGMTIDLWFVPTKTGTFELACAELCGFGHYEMRGQLIVMTAEEFKKWFEEKRNG
jgi:cytochrome c oxidase subunit 2